ncbi:MAG: hypothetical protein H0X02_13610 [Nitrosomonas sp.]|nr:hypothetical protein [Nitrosomonas sp.]
MLQRATIQAKSLYGRLFPLDTFRRFVGDQLLQSFRSFIYYGTLMTLTVIIIYMTGLLSRTHLLRADLKANFSDPDSIAESITVGFATIGFLIFFTLLALVIGSWVCGCYELAYNRHRQNAEAASAKRNGL